MNPEQAILKLRGYLNYYRSKADKPKQKEKAQELVDAVNTIIDFYNYADQQLQLQKDISEEATYETQFVDFLFKVIFPYSKDVRQAAREIPLYYYLQRYTGGGVQQFREIASQYQETEETKEQLQQLTDTYYYLLNKGEDTLAAQVQGHISELQEKIKNDKPKKQINYETETIYIL